MTAKRELAAAAVLGAAGSLLAVFASGRTWAEVTVESVGTTARAVSGSDLGAAAALGWAGLAAVVAVLATRGVARRLVGVLAVLLGAGIAGAAAVSHGRSDAIAALPDQARALAQSGQPTEVSVTSWWLAAFAGGLLLAAAGAWTAARSGRWPGMSARYDRENAPAKPVAADDPSSLWKSLDRGEDPTAGEGDNSHDPGTLRTPEREL